MAIATISQNRLAFKKDEVFEDKLMENGKGRGFV
jgi:hypothetical protein